jgi:hypothetical protein
MHEWHPADDDRLGDVRSVVRVVEHDAEKNGCGDLLISFSTSDNTRSHLPPTGRSGKNPKDLRDFTLIPLKLRVDRHLQPDRQAPKLAGGTLCRCKIILIKHLRVSAARKE